MKTAGKRLSKNYKRTFGIISAVLALFSVLTMCVLTYLNHQSVERQLFSIEDQKMERVCRSAVAAFRQVSTLTACFSTTVLEISGDSLQEYEMSWYNSVNKQLALCMTMFDYVGGIRVTNGISELQRGDFDSSYTNQEETALGLINATHLTMGPQSGNRLLFTLEPRREDYFQNRVYIAVNAYELGRTILDSAGQGQFQCVTDASGRVLIANRMEYLGRHISDLFGVPRQEELPLGGQMVKANGTDSIMTVKRMEGLNLYAFSLTPQSDYRGYYSAAMMQIVLLCVGLLAIALLLSFFIAQITYRPIRRILSAFDNSLTLSPLRNLDEVNFIRERIISLQQESSRLHKNIKETMLTLHQQQVLALQSQISPHFIFNMLDAINWISIDLLDAPNPIEFCIQKASVVLKSSMDLSTMFSTLRDEIHTADNCIAILKLRYNMDIAVNWDVPEEFLNHKVLKVCIQPIMENAVYHGFANQQLEARIDICVRRIQDDLRIVISDNGIGMTQEKLSTLRQSINDFSRHDASHIGLRNVNCRLKYLYGEQYGLTIKSAPSQGTACTLLMPDIDL